MKDGIRCLASDFYYVAKPLQFSMKLGNFISHQVVRYTSKGEACIKTPQQLNNLDRIVLANKFLNGLSNYCSKYGEIKNPNEITSDEFILDIARYIDKRLPQSYYKWKTKSHDKAPSEIQMTDDLISSLGFMYHFNEEERIR